MKIRSQILVKLVLLLTVAIGSLGWLAAVTPIQRETCVERFPAIPDSRLEGPRVGYELFNILGRTVWASPDWSSASFAELKLPRHWVGWRKNGPRVGLAEKSAFLRSPGCPENGQFTYMHAFGQEFFHVVIPERIQRFGDSSNRLNAVALTKHHRLTYATGQSVRILHAPNDLHYIEVSRALERKAAAAPLPEGWSIVEYVLESEIQINLNGSVTVIRTLNQDSFQGPIDLDLNI